MKRPFMRCGSVATIALTMLLLAACMAAPRTPLATEPRKVTMLTPQELQQWLEAKDFVLINVHVPLEAEIPGTDAFIPYDEIEEHVDLLPADKQTKIVIYCRSGGMTVPAGSMLLSMGYTNLYELEGGFNAWQAAGYDLVKHLS